jgi:hypothetical protein
MGQELASNVRRRGAAEADLVLINERKNHEYYWTNRVDRGVVLSVRGGWRLLLEPRTTVRNLLWRNYGAHWPVVQTGQNAALRPDLLLLYDDASEA